MKSLIFIMFSSILTVQVIAQNCGVISTPESKLYIQQTLLDRTNYNTSSRSVIYVPVVLWDFRTSSGLGGTSSSNLDKVITDLNTNFIASNVQFYNCEGPYAIDNSTYYDFSRNEEFLLVNSSNNRSNKLNIYLFNSVANSSGTALNGYTYLPGSFLGNNSVFIDKSTISNGSTISHEVGHFLSLNHTHGSSNTTSELVNGSNCTTAGDYICDTEADPNLSNLVNPTNCSYFGFSTDANGQFYNPNTHNIMSYSWRDCRDFFSTTQGSWIYYSAQNDYAFTCSTPPPSPTISLCDSIKSITCGQTISNTTSNSSSSENMYSCSQNSYDGNEMVYGFTISNTSRINISLTNANSNIDIFLLTDCDTNICIATGDNSISYPNASPGSYYIILDGKNSYNGSFDITLSCEEGISISSSVSPSNGGITSGDGYYYQNDSIFLQASPNACWDFIQWSADGALIPISLGGMDSNLSIVGYSDSNFVANFQIKNFKISTNANISGVSNETGSGYYNCDDSATIKSITIDSSYEFLNWSINNQFFSAINPYTFIVSDSIDIIAVYGLINVDSSINPSSIIESEKSEFIISPNPTNGIIKIKSEKNNITEIKIFSETGVLVYSDISSKTSMKQLDLSNFNPGFYTIQISDNSHKLTTHKIILK